MRTLFASVLSAAAVALALIACSSDGSGSSSSSGGSSGGSSSGSTSSTSSTSSSSSSTSSGSSGGGTKALGDDCTAASECKDGKCVKFTDNMGKERGFCSRQCTKAEDCPESGWECNLAPYTACVPKK